MRILLINTFVGGSSTGNIVYDLYQKNIRDGDECVIAYGRRSSVLCENTYKISNVVDYSLHCLWTRITDLNGFGSAGITRKLIKFIKDYKPDIIHLHNLHGYYLNIKIFFEFLGDSNIPIVWTFHDCWPYTGHCPYYSNIGCKKWMNECHDCPKKNQHPASCFMDNSRYNYWKKKELFHIPKKIVITPVSEWLAHEVRASFLGDCDIRTVYNSIDLSIFRPRPTRFKEIHGFKEKKMMLSVANNWVPSKGLNDVIELSKIITDEWQIVIVGLTDKMKKELPKQIMVIGRTESKEELAEIYSAADVFINPSREETFGLVTAEALACGTPAVVYDATASPELVDELTGRVVRVGDIRGLYLSAIELVKIRNIEKYCTERARKLFNKEINLNKYRKIYHEIAKHT